MEIFILILSSLISVLSPANLVGDKVAEGAIRAQFKQVEVLKVRIDNTPVHNLLKGKVDRVRVAGRGLYPLPDIRIDTLEMETDPLNLQVSELRSKKLLLKQPFGLGMRVVIRGEDVVRALKSPTITKEIQRLLRRPGDRDASPSTPPPSAGQPPESTSPSQPSEQSGRPGVVDQIRQQIDQYRIQNPQFQFLGQNRFALTAEIVDLKTSDTLRLQVESGIEVLEGRRFQLIRPVVSVNGQTLSDEFVRDLASNLSDRFDLQRLEPLLKVRARIFKLDVKNGQLEIAGFVGLPAGFKI